MQQGSNLEIPLRVIGPDGTTLWQGSGWLGVVYLGTVQTAVTESNAVMLDSTWVIQASNLAASATVVANKLLVKPTTGAAVQGVLGAALSTVPVNGLVPIAGPGSIALVTTGTAGTLGHWVVPAASGSTTQTAAGVTGPNQNVGRQIKLAGATGGSTDTGTASRLGAIIDTCGVSL